MWRREGVEKKNFIFMFIFVCDEGEWASSRYRSTSPVMRAGAFDCGERWVRVGGRVCGLMYVYCDCTAREESMFEGLWGVIVVGLFVLDW